MRWLIILVGALALVVIMALIMTFAFDGTNNDYDFGMMGSWDDAMWFMMLIPAAIILVILVVLLVSISNRPAEYGPVNTSAQVQQMEPMTILDRRLASGDIPIEEYARLKNELTRR